MLIKNIETDARQEAALMVRKIEEEAGEQGKNFARDIIVQRFNERLLKMSLKLVSQLFHCPAMI